MTEKLVALVLSLLLFGFAYGLKRRTKSWTNPGVVFALFWFVMTFVPLLAVPEAAVAPWGMAFIVAAAVAFGMPSLFIDWACANAACNSRLGPKPEASNLLFVAFVCLQLGALACLLINLHLQGISPLAVFTDLMETAARYLTARYNHQIVANPFSQLGVMANYVGVAIGGFLVSRRSLRRNVLVYLLAFTPSFAHVLIYSDKGTIFLSAAYFFGAIIARRVRWGETDLINRRTLTWTAVALCILLPLMAIAMLVRGLGAWTHDEVIGQVIYHLRSYAFAHVYAFSDWFCHIVTGRSVMTYTDPEGLTWGYWTFMSVGQRIWPGYVLPDGYFSEYFAVSGIIQSNIYTMFRGLIYDFGVWGALVFMASFGWLSAFFYRQMLSRAGAPFAEAYYIFLAGYIYTSYIISLTIWTSALAAFVGVYIVLKVDEFYLTCVRRKTGDGTRVAE